MKEEGEVITADDAFIDTIYSDTLRLRVPNHTHQCHVNLVTYRITEGVDGSGDDTVSACFNLNWDSFIM